MPDGAQRVAVTFPLKHTAITARVGGTMAEYTVEQEFENPFEEPIEGFLGRQLLQAELSAPAPMMQSAQGIAYLFSPRL